MKKRMLFLTAMILGSAISTRTLAQDHFVLGVKAGYNSSEFRTDNAGTMIGGETEYSIKDDAKHGMLFGAFARIHLINNLSFQTELIYAKNGGTTTFTHDIDNYNSINSTYYTWDIPFLAHLRLIDLKIANIYGLAGPMVSFKASEDNKLNSLPTTTESIKRTQWSFQAGAGIEFWRLNFDARYSWGLNDASYKLERVSNNLTFSLGYKLFTL